MWVYEYYEYLSIMSIWVLWVLWVFEYYEYLSIMSIWVLWVFEYYESLSIMSISVMWVFEYNEYLSIMSIIEYYEYLNIMSIWILWVSILLMFCLLLDKKQAPLHVTPLFDLNRRLCVLLACLALTGACACFPLVWPKLAPVCVTCLFGPNRRLSCSCFPLFDLNRLQGVLPAWMFNPLSRYELILYFKFKSLYFIS